MHRLVEWLGAEGRVRAGPERSHGWRRLGVNVVSLQ